MPLPSPESLEGRILSKRITREAEQLACQVLEEHKSPLEACVLIHDKETDTRFGVFITTHPKKTGVPHVELGRLRMLKEGKITTPQAIDQLISPKEGIALICNEAIRDELSQGPGSVLWTEVKSGHQFLRRPDGIIKVFSPKPT